MSTLLNYNQFNENQMGSIEDISKFKNNHLHHVNNLTALENQNKINNEEPMDQDENPNNFEDLLEPFMKNLKTCGLYYHNDPPEENLDRKSRKTQWKKKGIKIYPYIVVSLMCLNAVRVFTQVHKVAKLDHHFLRELVYELWALLCAIKTFLLLRASENRIPIFFRDWRKLHNLLAVKHQKNITKLRDRATTITILGWVVVFLHTALAGYALFKSKLYDHALTPLMWDDWSFYPLSGQKRTITIVVYLVLHVYVTAASVFPVAFYHLICYVLTVEFR